MYSKTRQQATAAAIALVLISLLLPGNSEAIGEQEYIRVWSNSDTPDNANIYFYNNTQDDMTVNDGLGDTLEVAPLGVGAFTNLKIDYKSNESYGYTITLTDPVTKAASTIIVEGETCSETFGYSTSYFYDFFFYTEDTSWNVTDRDQSPTGAYTIAPTNFAQNFILQLWNSRYVVSLFAGCDVSSCSKSDLQKIIFTASPNIEGMCYLEPIQ